MKVLTSAKGIRDALHKLRPSKIAVAYVGKDWRSFITAEDLEEIVLSPRLGTNPQAVLQLMDELGDKHVHFLDELHAKFYIGNDAALLGSCNLSKYGIGENGLLEAAVTVHGEGVARLNEKFDAYRQQAQSRYRTRKAKLRKLRTLQAQTDHAQRAGVLKASNRATPITEYLIGSHTIHVLGLTKAIDTPDRTKVGKRDPGLIASGVDIDKYFSFWIQFERRDEVRENDWILWWWCTEERRPYKNFKARWTYADCVAPRGMRGPTSKVWPKFAGEVAGRQREVPFRLDSTTQAAISEVLRTDRFSKFLPSPDCRVNLPRADKAVRAFLDAVKKIVASS